MSVVVAFSNEVDASTATAAISSATTTARSAPSASSIPRFILRRNFLHKSATTPTGSQRTPKTSTSASAAAAAAAATAAAAAATLENSK